MQGEFSGFVLFLDIEEFTPISKDLAEHGNAGAAEIREFLNSVFDFPVQTIHANGGFVSIFSGDAFSAIFPDKSKEDDGIRMLKTVAAIREHFQSNPPREFETNLLPNPIEIRVRMTISYGKIEWNIYENQYQSEYIFHGEAIKEMKNLAEDKKDLSFSFKAVEKIGEMHFVGNGQRYLLREDCELPFDHPISALSAVPRKTIHENTAFLHHNFHGMNPPNEYRHCSFCFINLSDVDKGDLPEVLKFIHEKLNHYGGYLNKLDATDKGIVAFILFGAPVQSEASVRNMCEFSLVVVEKYPNLSIGLSRGNAFTGKIGCANIAEEYTAIGIAINLASRLMCKAYPKEVLTDRWVYDRIQPRMSFYYIKRLMIAGIQEPVMCYLLVPTGTPIRRLYRSSLIGRVQKLEKIKDRIEKSCESGANLYINVYGAKGMGKTSLVENVMDKIDDNEYRKFKYLCSENSHEFSLFRSIIRIGEYVHNQEDRIAKVMYYAYMGAILGKTLDAKVHAANIAGFLELPFVDSSISIKKKEIVEAIAFYIKQRLHERPCIICVSDINWLDSSSREILEALLNTPFHNPLIVLASSEESLDLSIEELMHERIKLEEFPFDHEKELIENLFRIRNIPDDTVRRIRELSNGNPYYTEIICDYLVEGQNIDHYGKLQNDDLEIPDDLMLNVLGRIDRLGESTKQMLRYACLIGKVFDSQILEGASGYDIEDNLHEAVSHLIIEQKTDGCYQFLKMIDSQAIRELMLHNESKEEMYADIGNAMVSYYDGSPELASHAHEIADHFGKTQLHEQAVEYYAIAGKYATDHYNNKKAMDYFNDALKIISTNNLPESRRAEIISHDAYRLEKGQKFRDAEERYAEAKDIFDRQLGEINAESAKILNSLAVLFDNPKRFTDALEHSERAIEIFEQLSDEHIVEKAKALTTRARILEKQANKDKPLDKQKMSEALRLHKNASGIFNQQGNIELFISSCNSIGVCYQKMEEYTEAEKYFSEALIRLRAGEQDYPYLEITILGSYAMSEEKKKDYEKAKALYQEALDLCKATPGIYPSEISRLLHSYAITLEKNEEYDDAICKIDKSIENGNQSLRTDHWKILKKKHDKAKILIKRNKDGDLSTAQELCEYILDNSQPVNDARLRNNVRETINKLTNA